MKKANILCLLSVALLTVSCSTDFLDTKSQTEIMADDIWKEKSLAEAYMYDIYFAFQDAGFTEELQASACDEAMFTHGREFVETNAGAVTDVNLGWFSKTQSGHQWQRLYLNIRSCNDFIEHVDDATFADDAKKQLKGEAYFLRAYFLHRLTRGFGGVPIQLKVTQLTDDPESFLLSRSSYTDCIGQVLDDIDKAAECLKDHTFDNTQKGRATLAAVKALKVRVLTDAASDLHDQATASAKSSLLASYKNPELLFYTQGSRTDKPLKSQQKICWIIRWDMLFRPMEVQDFLQKKKLRLSGVSFWQKVQIIFFLAILSIQKTKVVLRCRYLMALPVIMDGEEILLFKIW